MVAFIEYDSREQAGEALAARLCARLADAVATRGAATLVVSGGASPVGVFRALARIPLAWSKVVVLPTDERWVPLADTRSNEGMIRRELLQSEAARARLVGLYREAATPHTALADIETALAKVARPLDCVVLGMGSDGHTASLFPDAPDIKQSLASHADVVAPEAGGRENGDPPRASLTLHCLANARHIDVLFFGEDKRRVFAKACEPGPADTYPIRGVLTHPELSCAVHWAR